jgi:hypothetical protein
VTHPNSYFFFSSKLSGQDKDFYQMTAQSLLSTLPSEMIVMIAKNLGIGNLMSFQESSQVVRAATSDVSFYYSYFTQNYSKKSISTVYAYRNKIQNWKELLQRLYENNLELVGFFYSGRIKDSWFKNRYSGKLTDSEIEKVGFEVGEMFVNIYKSRVSSRNPAEIDSLKERIANARSKNPDLAKTAQWHAIEDLCYADFWRDGNYQGFNTINLDTLENWLNLLDFAARNNFTTFQQRLAIDINFAVIRNVANGSLDCHQGMKYVQSLITQTHDMADIKFVGYFISETKPETAPALAAVYDVMLKEIMGNRRHNYYLFYQNFVQELILSLAKIVHTLEYAQEYLAVVKNCLKWRLVVHDRGWRCKCEFAIVKRLCILDDELRDTIFDKGAFLDDYCLKDITEVLTEGCSESFRKACKQYLHPNEFVSEDNELVDAARRACRKRAKK